MGRSQLYEPVTDRSTTEHECDNGSPWTETIRVSSCAVTFHTEITVNDQSGRTKLIQFTYGLFNYTAISLLWRYSVELQDD
jgi:hypothetical protein